MAMYIVSVCACGMSNIKKKKIDELVFQNS